MSLVLWPMGVLVLSILLVRAMMAIAPRDAPDGVRKMQAAPVPTSAGLAAMTAMVIATAALFVGGQLGPSWPDWVGWLAVWAFAMGLVGAIDDVRPLPVRIRLAVQIAGAGLAVAMLGPAETFALTQTLSLSVWMPLAVAGSMLWLVFMVNAVNFMDGANGLAIGSTVIGLLGLATLAIAAGALDLALVIAAVVAALVGILVWNFPAGRIYAGDSGAFVAGAAAGALCLIAIERGVMPVWTAPVLFFPIIADVVLTLAWRIRNRRSAFAAHRDHHYQIALRAGSSHVRVTLVTWAASAHAALCAVAANLFPPAAALLVLVTFVALSLWLSGKARAYARARDLDQ